MSNEEEQLKNYKDDLLSVLHELIEACGDMALSCRGNYVNKLYPVRELCLGYLLLCRDNLKATILLLENNQGHQLYFICRNIFELAVTLFYILDAPIKMDERTDRYFAYNNSIKRQLGINILSKLAELGYTCPTETNSEKVNKNCEDFKEKYARDGKLKDDTWSGLNMVQMIESFSGSVKEEFLQTYHIGIKISNSYLHPTRTSLRQAIEDFYSGKIDYKFQLPATSFIAGLSLAIADKYLTQFSKGRPKFIERLEDIRTKLESFKSKYKIGKRVDETKL